MKSLSKNLGYIVERSELAELLADAAADMSAASNICSADPVEVPGGVQLVFSVTLFDSFDGLGEFLAIAHEVSNDD